MMFLNCNDDLLAEFGNIFHSKNKLWRQEWSFDWYLPGICDKNQI